MSGCPKDEKNLQSWRSTCVAIIKAQDIAGNPKDDPTVVPVIFCAVE
jgi:hypothetical protein